MARFIYITNAEYMGGLSLKLTFNDQSERVIDFASFFDNHSHPQYNKYCDPAKFKKFYISNGNVVWGKNWDLMFPIENLHIGKL